MKVYSAVIERCPQTGLFVGFVPGFPGAHSQGETLDEVNRNLSFPRNFVFQEMGYNAPVNWKEK